MAEKPIKTPLPADLPEDWSAGQIVAPDGTSVGLTEQHGYNYLMAAVNRAQSGVNAVNEAFETVSGKRTCRFVVGTSTAGWTEADCDYLCDGVDDQVEIQQAINALPKAPDGEAAARYFSPGEIVILTGKYHLTGTIRTASDCVLRGSSQGTVLIRDTDAGFAGEKNAILSLNPGSFLRDLSLVDADNGTAAQSDTALLSSWGTNTIENVDFTGGRSSIGIYLYSSSGSSRMASNGTVIKNCVFDIFDTAILLKGAYGSFSTIEANRTAYSGGVKIFVDVELGDTSGTPDHVSITGNSAIESYVRLKTSGGANSIIGNIFCGIEITNPGSINNNLYVGNIIANNILDRHWGTSFWSTPAITLGENTCGWFVTGNQIRIPSESEKYWPITDNGVKNDVRFNANDTGGGGGGTAGVTSFNGRAGAVTPGNNDYTAAMVGAVESSSAEDIQVMTQAEYDALTSKNPTTLYLIKE